MKRIYLILFLSLTVVVTTFGQRLTDEQVTSLAVQQKKSGMSEIM